MPGPAPPPPHFEPAPPRPPPPPPGGGEPKGPPAFSNKTPGNDPANIDRYYNRRQPGAARSGGIGGIIMTIIGLLFFGVVALLAIFGGHGSAGSGTSTVMPSIYTTTGSTVPLGQNTYCAPAANYSCASVAYSNSTKTLSVGFNQTTGYEWLTANVAFVPQSAAYENVTYENETYQIPDVSFSSPYAVQFQTPIQGGQTVYVSLPVSQAFMVDGNVTGTVWARYTVPSYNGTYYAEIANFSTPE